MIIAFPYQQQGIVDPLALGIVDQNPRAFLNDFIKLDNRSRRRAGFDPRNFAPHFFLHLGRGAVLHLNTHVHRGLLGIDGLARLVLLYFFFRLIVQFRGIVIGVEVPGGVLPADINEFPHGTALQKNRGKEKHWEGKG